MSLEEWPCKIKLEHLIVLAPDRQHTIASEGQVYVRDPDGVRVQFADVTYTR